MIAPQEFDQACLFIFADIRREISLGRASENEAGKKALSSISIPSGGGNFLAALGLLCYTEFAGKLKYKRRKNNGSDAASENFNLLFDDLGQSYKTLRDGKNDIYDRFRCGLAHEYYVKHACTICMLDRGAPAGISLPPTGSYLFVVEKYCKDLEQQFSVLRRDLYGA